MQHKVLQPTRRRLLRMGMRAGALGLAAAVTRHGWISSAHAAGLQWRTLIMIKLDGGNDALNTVVPYTDQLYYQYRPTVGLSKQKLIPLDASYAFNSILAPLVSGSGSAWLSGEMAVLLGIGFPDLVGGGSHFTASDIWGTAVPSIDTPHEGWITRLLNHLSTQDHPTSTAADAVLAEGFPLEAVGGSGIRAVVAPQPGTSIRVSSENPNVAARAAVNPSYAWMVQQQNEVNAMAAPFAAVGAIPLLKPFPSTDLGRQLAEAARIVVSGLGVPVIMVNQSTYDTHSDQAGQHTSLLTDLAQSIAAFRAEMLAQGLWDNVLVMTHSEFGRSIVENDGFGTDHGKAGTHFMLGGKVKGGLVGTQAPLSSVVTTAPGLLGLPYQTDFRQVYASVMQDWWGVPRATSDAVISEDGAFAVSYGSLGFVS